MQIPSAYLLVSHGSRDSRPQVAMQQLARLISEKVRVEVTDGAEQTIKHDFSQSAAISQLTAPPKSELLVGTAYLELSSEPLHEQIQQFSDRAIATGCKRLEIVPLFLLPGVHVKEDIPAEVELAQQQQKLEINLRPYLGSHPGLSCLIADSMTQIKADSWILLAHGSRRAGSKQVVEAMAKKLAAIPAYWAIAPKLEARVQALVAQGYQQIGILPYFLFAGGITEAIASQVEQLQEQFPTVNLQLIAPIGVSAKLADLIWDLVEK